MPAKSCITDGVNTCFTALQMKALDEKRIWHQVKTLDTKTIVDKAKALQKLLNEVMLKKDFEMTDGSINPKYLIGA